MGILEILMAERAKDQRKNEHDKLDTLIKKHEELIPNVQKTAVMVDLYWKCYAYGDELKPHVEFLDGIMLSSTRDIAPSCLENVDELIERQEKSLSRLMPRETLSQISLPRARSSSRTPTNPSSWRPMSRGSRMDGKTPRTRLLTGLLSSLRQRMHSLATLRTARLSPPNSSS